MFFTRYICSRYTDCQWLFGVHWNGKWEVTWHVCFTVFTQILSQCVYYIGVSCFLLSFNDCKTNGSQSIFSFCPMIWERIIRKFMCLTIYFNDFHILLQLHLFYRQTPHQKYLQSMTDLGWKHHLSSKKLWNDWST